MKSNKFPVINEITMVSPITITDLGVYVQLLEYDCMEGLITMRNLSNKRIKSIKQIVQIGKKFAASVQSVDEKSNNIMLSKKDVSVEDMVICLDNYKKLKVINNLVTLFANRLEHKRDISISINDIYRDFIWSLSVNPNEILLLLESATNDTDHVYCEKLCTYHPDIVNCWIQILKNKYQPKIATIEIIVEMTCFNENGITDIQQILLNIKNNFENLTIKLLKAPQYSITYTNNGDQTKMIPSCDYLVEKIKSELGQREGTFKVIRRTDN